MGIYANSSFTPAVKINQPIIPSGTLSIGGTGFYNVYSYSLIDVNIEDLLEKKLTSTLNLSLNNYTDLSASKINCAAFASCNQLYANIRFQIVQKSAQRRLTQI